MASTGCEVKAGREYEQGQLRGWSASSLWDGTPSQRQMGKATPRGGAGPWPQWDRRGSQRSTWTQCGWSGWRTALAGQSYPLNAVE